MTQAHVEPPTIPLIKGICDGNPGKYFANLKLRRYPTSITSYLYEFRMYFFQNGDPEKFLLFVRNFNMTLAETWTPDTGEKIQYLLTLVCGEALLQFDLFLLTYKTQKP